MGAGQAVHHHVVVAGRGVGVCGGDSGGLADKGRLKRVNTNEQVTAFSVYCIPNIPVARRENASTILYYRMQDAVERMVGLVYTRSIADRGLPLKWWRQVNLFLPDITGIVDSALNVNLFTSNF